MWLVTSLNLIDLYDEVSDSCQLEARSLLPAMPFTMLGALTIVVLMTAVGTQMSVAGARVSVLTPQSHLLISKKCVVQCPKFEPLKCTSTTFYVSVQCVFRYTAK